MRGRPLLPLLVVLLVGSTVEAQPPAPPAATPPDAPSGRVEIFGGFTFVAPRVDSTLTTSYAPPFQNALATASSAGQTLQVSSQNSRGVELGGAYFFNDTFGVQVLYGFDSFDAGGLNGPHTAHLEYIARMPPDYTPRPTTVDRQEDWPDTVGELKQRQLSVNAVGRWPLGRRVAGQVSGGLTYFRMEGLLAPLGYTVFQLGGHSTLAYFVHELEVALEPAQTLGFNLGGSVDAELTRGLALTADFRYFAGGTLSSPVTVARLLNPEEVIMVEDVETIQEHVQPPAVDLKPTRARFMGGIKIRF